jgi:hypothetical protein
VSAAGGNDALAGALAAGGAEALAPILSEYLYGKTPSELTPEQKETVSTLLGFAGSAIGGLAGNAPADVVAGGQAARAAVENNYLTEKSIKEYADCVSKNGIEACRDMRLKLDEVNRVMNEQLAKSCGGNADINCSQQLRYASDFLNNPRFDDPAMRALFANDLATTQKVFDTYGGQYRAPTPPPGASEVWNALFGGDGMTESGKTIDYATGFLKGAAGMILVQSGGEHGTLLYTMPPGVFGYDQYAAPYLFEIPLDSLEELRVVKPLRSRYWSARSLGRK